MGMGTVHHAEGVGTVIKQDVLTAGTDESKAKAEIGSWELFLRIPSTRYIDALGREILQIHPVAHCIQVGAKVVHKCFRLPSPTAAAVTLVVRKRSSSAVP